VNLIFKKPKEGFAFIVFDSNETAEKALAEKNHVIAEQQLEIKIALPRKDITLQRTPSNNGPPQHGNSPNGITIQPQNSNNRRHNMGGMGNGNMMAGPNQNCQGNGSPNGQNRKPNMQHNGNCNGHNCQNPPQKMHNNNGMQQGQGQNLHQPQNNSHNSNLNNSNQKNNSNSMGSNQNMAKAYNQNMLCNYCNCKQMPAQLSQQFQMMNGQNGNNCNNNSGSGVNGNNSNGQNGSGGMFSDNSFGSINNKACFSGNNGNGNGNGGSNPSNNPSAGNQNNGCNGNIGMPNGFLGSGNTHNLNFLSTLNGNSNGNSKQDQDMILAAVDFNRLNGQNIGMNLDNKNLQQKFNINNNNAPKNSKDFSMDLGSGQNNGNGALNGMISNKNSNGNFNIDTFSPNGLFKTEDKSLKFGQNQWLNHALLSDPLNGFNPANMLYTDKFFNSEYNTLANKKKNGFLGGNGQQSGNNGSNPDFSLLNLTNRFSAMNLNNPVNQFNLMNNIGNNSSTTPANNLLDNFASITNFMPSEDDMKMSGAGFLNQQLFNFGDSGKGKSLDLENLDTNGSMNNPGSRPNTQGPSKTAGLEGFDLDEPQNSSSLDSANLANFVRDNVASQACDIESFRGSDKSKPLSSGSREKLDRRDRCETPEIVNSIQQQILADDN